MPAGGVSAYYSDRVESFLSTPVTEVLGRPAAQQSRCDRIIDALDSHVYWHLSEPQYRSNADVLEPGSDDPKVAAEIEACRELADRLITARA